MNAPIRDVTLLELVEAMRRSPDDTVFRWYACSVIDADGVPTATETLRLTLGDLRRELGMRKEP